MLLDPRLQFGAAEPDESRAESNVWDSALVHERVQRAFGHRQKLAGLVVGEEVVVRLGLVSLVIHAEDVDAIGEADLPPFGCRVWGDPCRRRQMGCPVY